jgi:hypothetical protein
MLWSNGYGWSIRTYAWIARPCLLAASARAYDPITPYWSEPRNQRFSLTRARLNASQPRLFHERRDPSRFPAFASGPNGRPARRRLSCPLGTRHPGVPGWCNSRDDCPTVSSDDTAGCLRCHRLLLASPRGGRSVPHATREPGWRDSAADRTSAGRPWRATAPVACPTRRIRMGYVAPGER